MVKAITVIKLAPLFSPFAVAYYAAWRYFGFLGLLGVTATIIAGIIWYAYAPVRGFSRLTYPGPKPKRVYGNIGELRKAGGLNYALVHWVKTYGPRVQVFIGQVKTFIIADADLVRDVCNTNFKSFHDRPPAGAAHKPSKNLLFGTGSYWKRLRQRSSPIFDSGHLKRFLQPMQRVTNTATAKLLATPDGKEIEVFKAMSDITLEVIGATVFGDVIDARGDSPLTRARDAFDLGNRTQNPVATLNRLAPILRPLLWYIGPIISTARQADGRGFMDEMNRQCQVIIDKRRQNPEADPKDFIGLMMNAEPDPETGLPFTDEEITEQCRLFLIAGYETTANALTYSIFLLSQNPEVQAKMLAEIDQLKEDKAGEPLTYEDVANLQYVDWVLKEALRLFPPAFMVPRACTESCELADMQMEVGDQVMVSIMSIHHDAKYWPEPEAFRPERFDPESDEFKARHKFAYLPFGAGPRMCIGFRFAQEEAKLVLVELYSRMTFKLSPSQKLPLRLQSNVTQTPKDGVQVSVHPRPGKN